MRVFAPSRGRATACLVAAALALSACGRSTPTFSVRVGAPGTIDDLPYHVMRAQRLDRKHGLHLELSAPAGGARVLELLAAGQLDVSSSVGTVPVLNAAARGLVPDRVVVIAGNTVADPEHPANAIVVGSDIRSWADLSGQLIAVHDPNSLAAAAATVRLRHENVAGYRFVAIPLPNLGLAVSGGGVAAASMSEPFVTQAVLRGDGRVMGWVVGGLPLERMVVTVTVVSAEFHRRRGAVRALLGAFLQAVDWINANPSEARALVAERLGITAALGTQIHMLRWPRDARIDRRLLEAQQAVLVEAGLLQRVTRADQIVDETMLEALLAEKR